MPSDGDSRSFLPRIQSVFYSGFDVVTGPRIICQVPEGLIAVPQPIPNSTFPSLPPTPSSENTPSPSLPPLLANGSRNSSLSALVSPTEFRPNSRSFSSPQGKRSVSNNATSLFNFEEISKYVIPGPALCGRLVICSTKRHRIIGFPSQLRGKYQRNFFRFNLCFVFERTADLSCYEPIVRKISRVLASCEEESEFLSSPGNYLAIHAIIEQLYEDLNSYSETSIPIDQFNSIELKIFPFYPNPPAIQDWMVPIALINLVRRIEDNWDLTMAKVCRYIDGGVNHVSRIAHLADCDIKLTREAISNLLYYQVIMTVDIFQYSNMYTLRKSIQWLADEAHVKEECGPTLPNQCFTRMSMLEWMEEYDVQELGIDVRRFTSFGVIKGFLRRVHRYPIFLRGSSLVQSPTSDGISQPPTVPGRKRIKSFTGTPLGFPNLSPESPPQAQHFLRGRTSHIAGAAATSLSPDQATSAPPTPRGRTNPSSFTDATFPYSRQRRPSAAERILEQLRNRDQNLARSPGSVQASPRTSWIHYPAEPSSASTVMPAPANTATVSTLQDNAITPTQHPRFESVGMSSSRRQSLIIPMTANNVPPNSPNIPRLNLNPGPRPQVERSPSAPVTRTYNGVAAKSGPTAVPLSYPMELLDLLDGEHHTDELAVRFEAGWPLLQEWLEMIDDGQTGRVLIIYR
ncbi:NPR2-domain-containing protein [Gymnopus androsaceus JB14]|uniref:NPR2-domain-containing protein n=1 Tax=Gymnopus androsaceus JB14 TaxID=1447944 RepID=A0A6A4IM96_9AGAR|nr:NPR2-domain-containing protein [Gymnopus androsaceus JB14]